MAVKNIRKSPSRKKLIIIVGLAVLVVLGSYQFYRSRKRLDQPVIPSQSGQTAETPSTETEAATDAGKQPSSATASTPKSSSGASSSDSSSGPQAPYGSFVSTHEPGKSATLESVCTTTAGAQCYIQFTKDGVTKRLKTQTTDGGGSTIWDWNIQDAGLTAGSWQVTAVSTLNGKTASTQDTVKLKVGS